MRSRVAIAALFAALLGASAAPALVVSGRVLDPAGAPAQDVNLDFVDKATGDNLPLTGDVTDAGGSYSVDVPAATYIVRYRPPAGAPWAPLEEKTVRIDADATRPDVQLDDGWEVSGTLLDHLGAPVAGADLDFDDTASGGRIYTIRDDTDAAGAFSVLVPCGTYDITFEPPAGHPDAASRMEDIDVPCTPVALGTIQLQAGVVLQGSVTERVAGLPVIGADIDVLDPAGPGSLPTPGDDTDATGLYGVTVPPGSYTVRVEPPRGSRALPAEQEGVPVTGPTVLDFELEVGVYLMGTVTAAADGSPVEGVDLKLYDSATGAAVDTPNDNTDFRGTYRVTVATGSYDIGYRPPRGTPYQGVRLDGELVDADRTIDVSLEPGYRLTGRLLRAADLTPVPGIDVDLRDAAWNDFYIPYDDTDADGVFLVTVPPGTGYVLEIVPDGPYAPVRIDPVDVTADWTDLGDILLYEALLLEGVVRDPSGAGYGGADLDVFVAGTQDRLYTPDGETAPDGSYSLKLPAGTYDVRVQPPDLSNLGWETALGVDVLTSPTGLEFDLVRLLTGIAPPTGPTGGGSGVTVGGNRLAPDVAVTLGGAPLAGVSSPDPQTLLGTTTFRRAGIVDVLAEYPSGEIGFLTGAYEYLAPAVPTTLFLSRGGTDVLLTWVDTGQGVYTAVRATDPSLAGGTVLFQGAALQTADAGAAGDGALVFYDVQ